uniref:Hydroxyproline-rich systemin n=1 Tax=Petunia hybrida TaxID=4102 RepID=A5JP04_PETHY|nr:hydroxyproline-rich systemin precursor [Petunia x hybrida]
MTKIISFIRAFFLINFLIFIGAEARSLLEKHHKVKAESNYGRDPIPAPPSPSSSPPPSDFLMMTTSTTNQDHEHIISDHQQLISLPTSSNNYQERIGRHDYHLSPPPAPKPADHTGQTIITSSNSHYDHDHMNIKYGRSLHKSPPPTPKPSDEQGQIIITSSSYHNHNSNNFGRGKRLPPPAPEYDPPYHQVTSGHNTPLKPEEYLSDTALASY